jgi:hypothetical protein
MKMLVLLLALVAGFAFAAPAGDLVPGHASDTAAPVPAGQVITVQAVPPPAAVAAPDSVDWTQIILRVLMAVAGIIGTVASSLLLPGFKQFVQAHADSQTTSAAAKAFLTLGLKLESFVEAGVVRAWGKFEADISAAQSLDSDGGAAITPAELQKAKDDVLADVKMYLGQNGLAALEDALGFGGELLNTYLRAQIDKKVQAAKEAGSVAAASVTTGQAAAAVLAKV